MPEPAAGGTEADPGHGLKMLVFDISYTSDIILERDLTRPILARDLGGFFDHVWNVQPLDTIFLPHGSPGSYGTPRSFELAPRHTFIAGKLARYRWPQWLTLPNFIVAQIGLMRRLSRLIRDERIEIIRAEDPLYCGLLALYLARRRGLPLVIGVWGNPGAIRKATGRPLMPRLFRRTGIEEAVERFVLRRADRVIVQNEDNRRFVISMGVAPEKARFFRLGNILHPMHFEDPAARGDGQADLAELGLARSEVLLVISRLEALKFTDHVVRMLGAMKASRPNARVLFAGDGTQRAEIEALADKLGIADRIIFGGNRNQAWLYRVMPHVSAVVSPLTGRALAEAALAGVPLIAYDVDWHSELVETGVTGELVPHLDHEALARAAERVLADPVYAAMLGRNARARVLDMMDPARNDQAQREEYLELLEARSPAGRPLPAAA